MVISIKNLQKKVKLDSRQIRRTVRKLMNIMDCCDKEIGLVFVDDLSITEINRRYLGRDYSTNVISFSMLEGEFSTINPDILGDVIISVETALRDAVNGEISFAEELDFLIIHGLLHLLGYNHENSNTYENERMTKKEQELFFLLHGYSFTCE